jgi:ABC-type sugar transport system permease subunit
MAPSTSKERSIAERVGLPSNVDYWPYLYIAPLSAVFLIFLAYPIAEAVMMSFQAFPRLNQAEWVGLENYRTVLSDPIFWQSVQNTVVVVFGKAIAPIIFGLGLAMLLDKAIFGNTAVRTAIFVPYVVPIAVIGVLFAWLFTNNGIVNAFLIQLGILDSAPRWLSNPEITMSTVLALNTWRNTGYFMVILLAGLQGIPDSMYDAAKVMGRSRWEMFRYITLPLLKPSLVIVSVLGLLDSVRGFADVWLIAEGGPNHATDVLATYFFKQAFLYFNFGVGAAVGWIIFAITLVLSYIIISVSEDD